MKKTFEERMEKACNRMVTKGKLPGFIYLSKKTLAEVAKELKVKVFKGEIKDTKPYTCYFRIDDNLPLGKFKLGPMDEKYFEYEKELKARGVVR